jgi:hypothetical protein
VSAAAGILGVLSWEARALLTRLARVKPFALSETMVPAAGVSFEAQTAIERHLARGRRRLARLVRDYLGWLEQPDARRAPPEEAQRRFTLLRLQFNAILSQFDIFAEVLAQRSEHETGVWLSGLDVIAADGLRLPGDYYQSPPVICYVDRSHGAAIRRVRTRLPGGDRNPVAVIRVPRERMVGTGIASSLIHEVGHQGSALLGLIESLRPVLRGLQRGGGSQRVVWQCWERWLSETLADLWAVGRVGIAAPHGLMGVVSLPRPFVFRVDLSDPHSTPWIRVKMSCALGNVLYPDRQWDVFARIWAALYPIERIDGPRRALLEALDASLPAVATLLVEHRAAALGGKSLREALTESERQPARLRALHRAWQSHPKRRLDAPPSLALAVIAQGAADELVTPESESRLVGELLTHWALQSTLDRSAICAQPTLAARPAARMIPTRVAAGLAAR